MQDAFAIAAERWPREGTPASPGAWLYTTARNRAINRIRRERTLAAKRSRLAADALLAPPSTSTPHALASDPPEALPGAAPPFPDERLALIFACCHPALAADVQVALTLRALGGLTTAEIAHAFLVPEPTMAQRLVRAKRKLRASGIPFRVPQEPALTERLEAVLAVVYLIFNRGYSAPPERGELAAEALRLGHALGELLPAHADVHALVSLMLLHDSRRAARERDGELVLLADQDRSRWDRASIAQGLAALARARATADAAAEAQRGASHAAGSAGPSGAAGSAGARDAATGTSAYLLQAEIAAQHTTERPDWLRIALLYARLARVTSSPVVELNRAIAIAEAEGPAAGLAIIETLPLEDFHYLHSARAELLRRLGRMDAARESYARALALVHDDAERRLLQRRLADLGDAPPPPCAQTRADAIPRPAEAGAPPRRE